MMIWMCGAFSENVIGFPRKSSGVDDDKAMQDHITLDEVECAEQFVISHDHLNVTRTLRKDTISLSY